jgi:hypothetical protein
MRDFRMLFGAVRHMARIGEDSSFKALRQRNEDRLAALKAAHRLTEDKNAKPVASGGSSLANITTKQLIDLQLGAINCPSAAYATGSALCFAGRRESGFFDD